MVTVMAMAKATVTATVMVMDAATDVTQSLS